MKSTVGDDSAIVNSSRAGTSSKLSRESNSTEGASMIVISSTGDISLELFRRPARVGSISFIGNSLKSTVGEDSAIVNSSRTGTSSKLSRESNSTEGSPIVISSKELVEIGSIVLVGVISPIVISSRVEGADGVGDRIVATS